MNQATETEQQGAPTTVHFSIEGAFVTEMARDFLREGEWRKGYHFLMDNMEGMDAQQAMDILRGTKQLTGVNDLDFVDDDCSAELTERLAYLYGDCFQFNNRFYKPYGTVSAFTREDWRFARGCYSGSNLAMSGNDNWRKAYEELSSTVKGFNPWEHYKDELVLRPFFYARDARKDIMLVADVPGRPQTTVLCEEVQMDMPLWFAPCKDAQAVIRQAFVTADLVELTEQESDYDIYDEEPSRHRAAEASATDTPSTGAPAPDTDEVSDPVASQPTFGWPFADTRNDVSDETAGPTDQDHADIFRQQIEAETNADTEYGWLELAQYDAKAGRNVTLRVPHRAFICSALSRAKARHLMPEYMPRCPSGLKMYNDDRLHTDAWVGAGMQLDDAYNDDLPEQRLFMDKMYELQRKWLQTQFDILAKGSKNYFYGEVTHDPEKATAGKILVLDKADPVHASAAMRSMAVIVQTGSRLAHLVVVSREEGVPVIRIADAKTRFPEGRKVTLDFDEGTVELSGIC